MCFLNHLGSGLHGTSLSTSKWKPGHGIWVLVALVFLELMLLFTRNLSIGAGYGS